MIKKISFWCFIASGVLTAIFAVKNVTDYVRYSTTLNSAPFYYTVILNAAVFILPALTALAVGIVLRSKKL